MILISSCLAGLPTRYDGRGSFRQEVAALLAAGKAVPACPEQLGGLATPRRPAEIVGGNGEDVLDGRAKVMTDDGDDVTLEFVRGAEHTLSLARTVGAKYAVLKEASPSCGGLHIYDGTHSGTKRPGFGVTAALLRRHGIEVFSEVTFPSFLAKLREESQGEEEAG